MATSDTPEITPEPEDTELADTDLADIESLDIAADKSAAGNWWQRNVSHFSYAGAVLGMIMLWLSMTPSILPRGPLFQGVVSGGAAAIGYAIGTFFAWLARYLVSRENPWPRPRASWWLGLAIVAALGTAYMLWYDAQWQRELRTMMGVDQLGWSALPVTLIVAIIVFVLLMVGGQLWGAAVRGLSRWLSQRVPRRISGIAAAGIIGLITIFVVNGVVADYGMRALNKTFATVNGETTPDSAPPTTVLRSGGPESLVSWESLGRQGRIFVSTGPTVAQLSEFNGAPATEPIRVYAGLESADNARAAGELVAAEMERTGAFRRKLIGIGMSTGTGWINRANPETLEYMYNGDTAMVSMQYSMLPSWLSFLVDQERARQAGVALYEAIDRRVRNIPEAERPKVVVYGESLGSFGAEAPFGSIPTMAARTDGALLTGPTFSNQLWADTTAARDAGSPQWLPIFENGDQVRFIAEGSDLARPDAPWSTDGRIVYLQHPSDPISWWSPKLALNRPDWLEEERGRDVLPSTRWIPIVTFLQVAADMAVSVNVPDGHGHTYLRAIPESWAAILQPPGWTPEKTQRLIPLLRRD